MQHVAAEAHDGLGHDRQDRRPDADEYRLAGLRVGAEDIAEGEGHHADRARQDEQAAGNDSADRAIGQPSDIDGQLLRFRPRQRDAVAQGVEEAVLGDPALSFDGQPVHGRDLLRRPADPSNRHVGPYAEGIAQCVADAERLTRGLSGLRTDHRVHGPTSPVHRGNCKDRAGIPGIERCRFQPTRRKIASVEGGIGRPARHPGRRHD